MKTESLLSSAAAQCAGLAIGLMALLAASPARANLVIVPNYLSSITNDPNAATIENTINNAIADYAALIADPMTVNIDFQEGGGLGSSSTAITQLSYSTYRTLLALHASSADDATAMASLPVQSNSPVDNQSNMWLTTANARALGFSELGSPDSTITLNTSIMNLDRTGSNDPSKYDLKSVVEHEIDEALGLGSGLNLPSDFPRLSRPQDLFRYSGPGVRSYDTSSSATSYLSIDGGVTSLVPFNQNGAADYGDWAATGITHVQDAFGTPGSQPDLNVELTNLDVIGYTLTPEPSTAILAAGLGVVALRRGRRIR